jgi:hypothetical protein
VKASSAAGAASAAVAPAAPPATVTNGIYEVSIDHAAGVISSVKNVRSGATSGLNVTWGYYESSEGGCTKEPNGGKPQCSSQPSGAYMFRPAQQYTHSVDNTTQPTIEVKSGALFTEIKQVRPLLLRSRFGVSHCVLVSLTAFWCLSLRFGVSHCVLVSLTAFWCLSLRFDEGLILGRTRRARSSQAGRRTSSA